MKLRHLDTVIRCVYVNCRQHPYNIALQDIWTLHIENPTAEVGLLFDYCLIKVPGIITPIYQGLARGRYEVPH